MEDYNPNDDISAWFGQTTVHPVGLAVVIALAIATLLIPRRWAFAPLVLLSCFLPVAQRVVIFNFDFDFPRLLIVAAMLRFLIRGEFKKLDWNSIDKCFLWFAVISFFAFIWVHGDSISLTRRLGWMLDVVGFYFVFRLVFMRSVDVKDVVLVLAIASIPVAIVFAVEYSTHRNLFSVFGSVPPVTWIRGGRLRCQGPFVHPIIAGCFWGSLVPVFASLWFCGGRWRMWSLVSVSSAMVIVLATNSSTSIMAVIFGAIALLAFPLRNSMRVVCWTALLLAIALHAVMKAPVWHLLARATVFDASTGWHRYFVIDQAIRHFGDWFLVGIPDTNSWGVWDITNGYVWVAIEGGFFALAMFMGMIWKSYRRVGDECRRFGKDPVGSHMAWSLGCTLFVHCTNFLGVSYFGQARMLWYLTIALIASMGPRGVVPAGSPARAAAVARGPAPRAFPRAWGRRAARKAAPSPAPPGRPPSAPGGAKLP